MEKGLVFDIHRGTTHDGPGMRTTVFLKGCPLHCRWCQNPESISPVRELQWDAKKCIGCMSCVTRCAVNALAAQADGIRIDRTACRQCFTCADQCPTKAMGTVGEYWETARLVKEACKDDMFFDDFSGGVTVSGGEPVLQHRFLAEFLEALKRQGVDTALDTSGFGKKEIYEKIYPYVDTFLYDIKFMDEKLHREYTGVSNKVILDNLKFIAGKIRSRRDSRLWIRTPLIPGATATKENIEEIGRFVRKELADVIERWELCAFNHVCKEKYAKIGKEWDYDKTELMEEKEVQKLAEAAGKYADGYLAVSGLTKEQGAASAVPNGK